MAVTMCRGSRVVLVQQLARELLGKDPLDEEIHYVEGTYGGACGGA